jgi:hypothetical protein
MKTPAVLEAGNTVVFQAIGITHTPHRLAERMPAGAGPEPWMTPSPGSADKEDSHHE